MARLTLDGELQGTMLPVQFFSRAAFANSPEKRLILAVLMDAVEQLQRGDPHSMADAERWIRSEIEDPAIGFVDACDSLGLDAKSLADVLMVRRTH